MSLKSDIATLNHSNKILTTASRAAVYMAASRAGIKVTTSEVDGGLEVRRVGAVGQMDAVAVETALRGLSRADRLSVFESFELCCGMNIGECICPPEHIGVVPMVETNRGTVDAAMAQFLDAARAPVVEEWRFTNDPPEYHENGNVYRRQALAPEFKKRRSVQVDEDDHEVIL